MASTAPTDKTKPERKAELRNRWISAVVAVLCAVFVSVLGYFGLHYLRTASYHDERSFRVLTHVVTQFRNLQEAISGALSLAPSDLDCTSHTRKDPKTRQHCSEYLQRLALRGEIDVRRTARDDDRPQFEFEIDTAASKRRFSVCRVRENEGKAARECSSYMMSGNLSDQIQTFISQDLFDSVAIVTEQGDVLAVIQQGHDLSEYVTLHSATTTSLFEGGAHALLREAKSGASTTKKQDQSNEQRPEPSDEISSGPAVYVKEVAGQQYRVFVLPFLPAYTTRIAGESSALPRLYAVGLKHQDVSRSLSEVMGPGGALFITLAVLLTVLAWPLVSLRFSSPQEAIAPTQMLAILLSLVLIPAVLATTAFSTWTRYRLVLWADAHAELYALRVEQQLHDELHDDIHILETLARQFIADEAVVKKKFEVSSKDFPAFPGNVAGCAALMLRRVQFSGDWCPIRSAAPLNLLGRTSGLTISFFNAPPPASLNLSDREYAQAILAGDEWHPEDLWTEPKTSADVESQETEYEHLNHRFVAQRLFNRTDAAKALQVSIPMDKGKERIGLVTGDTRAYALTADLRAPLLRFVIFDQHTGTVLFHSEDQFSLAENLLTETEGSSLLGEAMNRRASARSRSRILMNDHFGTRYTGSSHRFYYRPVPGTPWGLVVQYELDEINAIVLQTAVATLATYFSLVILACLALALLVPMFPQRIDRSLLKLIWPKWQSRVVYQWTSYGIWLALSVTAAAIAWATAGWLPALCLLLAAVAMAVVFARREQRARSKGSNVSVLAYYGSYVTCVFGGLCLLAILAAAIAWRYHDTSVYAFIREELLEATRDEEQRRRLLMRDQSRFNGGASANLDEARELSRLLPVPGYKISVQDADGSRGETVSTGWLLTDVAPIPWLAAAGPQPLSRFENWIWRKSTSRQVRRPIAASAASAREPTANSIRAWRRSEDGTRVFAAMPLISEPGDLQIAECIDNTRSQTLCRDTDLHRLYKLGPPTAIAILVLGTAILLRLLAAYAARRLLGVRIPFAGRFTERTGDPAAASELLDLELQLISIRKTNRQMTSKDAADWRAVKCRAVYDRMWSALSAEEQLLLHHLAHGRYPNPENRYVIEDLLTRGYVTLAPWVQIVEPGFVDFIRRVHPSEGVDELRYQASHTGWSRWRKPLLAVIVITAAALMWVAGSAMHIVAATLAGTATLLGSITQVTSFIHRERTSPDKNAGT